MTTQEYWPGNKPPELWPDRCGQCVFYHHVKPWPLAHAPECGPCKRFPPQVSRGMSQWPQVNANDPACGEGFDASLFEVDDDDL